MKQQVLFSDRPLFQREKGDKPMLLVIQCDSGHMNGDLIACARYRIYDERVKAMEKNKIQGRNVVTHVLFIINLPYQVSGSSFVGFQGDPWISAHIDDLRPSSGDTIEPLYAISTTISKLFIGEYIHDIGPLLGEAFEPPHSVSESESDESSQEDATLENTLSTPLVKADEEAEIEEEENSELEIMGDDTGGNQTMTGMHVGGSPKSTPELQHHDLIIEPSPPLELTSETLEQHSLSTLFESLTVAPHEQQREDESAMEPTAVAAEPTEEMAVIDIEENGDMEFAAVGRPEDGIILQHIEPVPSAPNLSLFSQEEASQVKSGDEDGHQDGQLTQIPYPDEMFPVQQDDLTHAGENIIQSQTVQLLYKEPQAPQMPAVVNVGGATTNTEVLSEKYHVNQHPIAQCRRLYSCIQAAASKLEDSTKDRSIQRVTRLTKLISRNPNYLSNHVVIL